MILTKICCVQSVDEARFAIEEGASAIGLVSEMPSGPGVIDENTIRNIARAVRGRVRTVLLTSRTDVESIIEQHRRCETTTIQFCDRLAPDALPELSDRLSGVTLMPVVHVVDERSTDEAVTIARHADALLLDSGDRSKSIKELGGTGRTHDWSISARIVEAVEVPVFLAGGLNPENVVAAIRAVRPGGVDVCSGLRVDGRLDPDLLRHFIAAVRSCDT